jgi:cytochrome d ubiquinol oxidase subunit II
MFNVQWANEWHGLEALINGRNLALGLSVLFLARVNGLLYIINSVEDGELISRSVKKLIINSISFLVFFLFFLATLLVSEGYALDKETGQIVMEKFKYLHNFIRMPVVPVLFLTGVVAVLYGIVITIFRSSRKGIWFSGAGTLITVFALFLVAGFNGTSFYPSSFHLQSSLTIYNASSSQFTLKTMMYISFIIPFVVAYIWYAWKAINKKRITEDELKEDGHIY